LIARGSVKICGLREIAHARFVVDAGADLFGLIFAPARRQVTVERATEIVEEVRALSPAGSPLAIGVFVDAAAGQINHVARSVGLDLVQLQGTELPEFLGLLDLPAIKSFRPLPGTSIQELESEFEAFAESDRPPVAFLIDGYDPAHAGGQGVRADWSLAAELAVHRPVMLAGGLSPENVGSAVEKVRPLAVDVSSGVETDGTKNPVRIETFVRNAKAAFRTNVASRG
jgi:phosphoribosylanthranilate isomerase